MLGGRGLIPGWLRIETASWRCKLIESIFVRQCAIAKHKEGPLLKEREAYLLHLAKEEKCPTSIQGTATVLMDVIRVMNMTNMRQVNMSEIRLAGELWAGEELIHRRQLGCKTSALRFIRTARGWFRFHGVLIQSAKTTCCFDRALEDFVNEMRYNAELSPITVKTATVLAYPIFCTREIVSVARQVL